MDTNDILQEKLKSANLVLATLNDMLCGDDGPRGDVETIKAARKILQENEALKTRLRRVSVLAERVERAMERDGLL